MSVEIIEVVEIDALTGTPAVREARRVMEICNACRYCEGFCAVFQAMERRREFPVADLNYLANLCHNCTACYHACQYAPPHEFSMNVPTALAALRAETYENYAWPKPVGKLFANNGLVVSLVVCLALVFVMSMGFILQDASVLQGQHTGAGAFYKVISHEVMVGVALTASGASALALVMGFINFWRHGGLSFSALLSPVALYQATKHAATLKYLGGGHGDGCNTESASFSNQRRIYHHFMAWGFMLCFAATSCATVYEYFLGIMSPFDFFSLPVMLGTTGGIGLLIGPAGLVWIKLKSDTEAMLVKQYGMDYGFLSLLFYISLSGLLLLAFRESSAMGWLLVIHLGFVFGFFLVLPYSKFVHAVYRYAALIRFVLEQKQDQKAK